MIPTPLLLGIHLAAALVALVQGVRAWWAPRGAVDHRRLGAWYVGAVVPLCLTAWELLRRSQRAAPTLAWLAGICMALGLLAPLLARRVRPRRHGTHGIVACLSLGCLAGAVLEVLHPGPWTWPFALAAAGLLLLIPRPFPGDMRRPAGAPSSEHA